MLKTGEKLASAVLSVSLIAGCSVNPVAQHPTTTTPATAVNAKMQAASHVVAKRVYSLNSVVNNHVLVDTSYSPNWSAVNGSDFGFGSAPPGFDWPHDPSWDAPWMQSTSIIHAIRTFSLPNYSDETFNNSQLKIQSVGVCNVAINNTALPQFPIGTYQGPPNDYGPTNAPVSNSLTVDIGSYLKPGQNQVAIDVTADRRSAASMLLSAYSQITGDLLTFSADSSFDPTSGADTISIHSVPEIPYWNLDVDGQQGSIFLQGHGDRTLQWDGTLNGAPLPNGTYTLRLHSTPTVDNPEVIESTAQVTIARTALGILPSLPSFSPDGDGQNDFDDLTLKGISSNSDWNITLDDGTGNVGTIAQGTGEPSNSVLHWNGTATYPGLPSPVLVNNALYTLTLNCSGVTATTMVTVAARTNITSSVPAISTSPDARNRFTTLTVTSPGNWVLWANNKRITSGGGNTSFDWYGTPFQESSPPQAGEEMLKDGVYSLAVTSGKKPTASDPSTNVVIDSRSPELAQVTAGSASWNGTTRLYTLAGSILLSDRGSSGIDPATVRLAVEGASVAGVPQTVTSDGSRIDYQLNLNVNDREKSTGKLRFIAYASDRSGNPFQKNITSNISALFSSPTEGGGGGPIIIEGSIEAAEISAEWFANEWGLQAALETAGTASFMTAVRLSFAMNGVFIGTIAQPRADVAQILLKSGNYETALSDLEKIAFLADEVGNILPPRYETMTIGGASVTYEIRTLVLPRNIGNITARQLSSGSGNPPTLDFMFKKSPQWVFDILQASGITYGKKVIKVRYQ